MPGICAEIFGVSGNCYPGKSVAAFVPRLAIHSVNRDSTTLPA